MTVRPCAADDCPKHRGEQAAALSTTPAPDYIDGGLDEFGNPAALSTTPAPDLTLCFQPGCTEPGHVSRVHDPDLDVERLAAAWAHVMDGRRIGQGLNAARISGGTTNADDWQAILAEYDRLAREYAKP